MAKALAKYVTRRGHEVSIRMTRTEAAERLKWLDNEEAHTRTVAPTDSGDVRDSYLREAAAIRAALA